jgi:cobalt-zinc-cadmium resistance protein CzcA
VRSTGAIRTLEDLSAVVVRPRPPASCAWRSAAVRIGSLTRYGAVTRDGKGEAVEGLVIGLRGRGCFESGAGGGARLTEIAPSLPKGMSVSVFYDRSELIERAVGTVEEALLEATVLVIVLLLLFLGDARASVIVALALPMAALLTFICMRAIGLTANLMSLAGWPSPWACWSTARWWWWRTWSSAFGRATCETGKLTTSGGLGSKWRPGRFGHGDHRAGVPAAADAGRAGGQAVRPVALTIVLALLSALVLSLTLVPVLAYYVLKCGWAITNHG